jgi:hypothetical protein
MVTPAVYQSQQGCHGYSRSLTVKKVVMVTRALYISKQIVMVTPAMNQILEKQAAVYQCLEHSVSSSSVQLSTMFPWFDWTETIKAVLPMSDYNAHQVSSKSNVRNWSYGYRKSQLPSQAMHASTYACLSSSRIDVVIQQCSHDSIQLKLWQSSGISEKSDYHVHQVSSKYNVRNKSYAFRKLGFLPLAPSKHALIPTGLVVSEPHLTTFPWLDWAETLTVVSPWSGHNAHQVSSKSNVRNKSYACRKLPFLLRSTGTGIISQQKIKFSMFSDFA